MVKTFIPSGKSGEDVLTFNCDPVNVEQNQINKLCVELEASKCKDERTRTMQNIVSELALLAYVNEKLLQADNIRPTIFEFLFPCNSRYSSMRIDSFGSLSL